MLNWAPGQYNYITQATLQVKKTGSSPVLQDNRETQTCAASVHLYQNTAADTTQSNSNVFAEHRYLDLPKKLPKIMLQ